MGMTKSRNAPGQAQRKGITIVDAVHRFGEPKAAEEWLIGQRWPDGVSCVECGSDDVVSWRHTASDLRWWRCRAKGCGKRFSVKTNSVMQQSKLPLSHWCMAFFFAAINLKGVSSMKLHRDLGITQKSAWFLGQRIRKVFDSSDGSGGMFNGPVEVDETYIGGAMKNRPISKRVHVGGGPKGKAVVVGMRDRATNEVVAQHVPNRRGATVKPFVTDNTREDALVFTDDSIIYSGLTRTREVVNHSVGEFVRGMAHTNGIESLWSMLKRGYYGVYHHFSVKHLHRYVAEFAGRHNIRQLDTIEQMGRMVAGALGKRLTYKALVGPSWTRQPRML